MKMSIKITPPRGLPQVILKMKETYNFWLTLYRDFPKVERFGIGNKVEQNFLDTLELTFCLSYLSPEHKIPLLNKAITKLDIVKFFTQLAWESKLLSTDKYSDLLSRLEEIGRQLGGWKKGLQSKTPAP
jgi:hypothetical protein